ncbi:MAG: LysR family transcriptional regulator [Deltaproteobacteria bacterium]|nr:LysR family transcriptional regulator [Deltaproteobacteria bacterium]
MSTPLDEVGDLYAFRVIAEERSFTRAARRAGLSKSRLSARLARLEHEAGTTLLERTTRSVRLTPAGAELLERCSALPAAVGEARAALRAIARGRDDELRGLLRVTAPSVLGRTIVAEAAAEMQLAHPSVTIDLLADNRYVDVSAGEFDVYVRMASSIDGTLVGRRLATMPQVVVGAPSYLARRGAPRAVADLAAHSCLAYRTGALGSGVSEWRFVFGKRVRSVEVSGPFVANDGEAQLRACLAGVGLLIMPRYRVDALLRSGELVDVLPGATPVPQHVWALFQSGQRASAKARRFVELLAPRLQTITTRPERP